MNRLPWTFSISLILSVLTLAGLLVGCQGFEAQDHGPAESIQMEPQPSPHIPDAIPEEVRRIDRNKAQPVKVRRPIQQSPTATPSKENRDIINPDDARLYTRDGHVWLFLTLNMSSQSIRITLQGEIGADQTVELKELSPMLRKQLLLVARGFCSTKDYCEFVDVFYRLDDSVKPVRVYSQTKKPDLNTPAVQLEPVAPSINPEEDQEYAHDIINEPGDFQGFEFPEEQRHQVVDLNQITEKPIEEWSEVEPSIPQLDPITEQPSPPEPKDSPQITLFPPLNYTSGGVSLGLPYRDPVSGQPGSLTYCEDPNKPSCGDLGRSQQYRKIEPILDHIELAQPDELNRYGTGLLVDMIHDYGMSFRRLKPEYKGNILVVNDLSAPYGGYLPPHKSHQSGRDADIYYLDREPYRYVGAHAKAIVGGTTVSGFDYQRNVDFFSHLISTEHVVNIFVNKALKQSLCEWAQSQPQASHFNEILTTVAGIDGHKSHFHLRVKCSPEHPACRQVHPVIEPCF